MDHNHHMDCKHEDVRYCEKCDIAYCVDCNKEWVEDTGGCIHFDGNVGLSTQHPSIELKLT